MTALVETAQYIGIFVLGVILRAAIFVALIALIVAVLAPLIYAYDGGRLALFRAAGLRWFHGLEWRRSRAYTPGHLWLRQRRDHLRLGLDDLAAHILRRPAGVLLPERGTQLREGEPLATFHTGAHQVTLPAPFDGVVSAVNARVARQPALSTEHPYGRGWLLELVPGDDVSAALPRLAASRRWFDHEASRFAFAIDRATGVAMADGGEPIASGVPVLGDADVARLAHEFLQAEVTAAARA